MSSRTIPEEIKRRLRREAYFGCCVCGNPIFIYHHIIPFSQVQRHRFKDMIILCPYHHTFTHDYKENPTYSIKTLRKFKKNPSNKNTKQFSGLLTVRTNKIKLGPTEIILDKNSGIKIYQEGKNEIPLTFFTENKKILLISGAFYDKKGRLLAELNKNNIICHTKHIWDIKFKNQYFMLKKRDSEIFLEINSHVNPIQIRANIWWKGKNIILNKNEFSF